MVTVASIAGILALGIILTIAIRQSYNLVFIALKKPWYWVIVLAFLSVSFWTVAASLNWSVNTPAWATTLALLLNLPPNAPTSDKVSDQLVEEIYSGMGVPKGRKKYRFGLFVFAAASIVSWMYLYGRVVSA
jgi:hypothetical protein